MANDVKWIKLTTDIFDNSKIKQIEKMPSGDSILVVWIKILCLAGKSNQNGFVYMAEDIPFTEQMLAVEFGKPIEIIQMALSVFERFHMIEVIDSIIHVSNWEKYQNVQGLDKIREQTRKRVANHRNKQKLLESNVTCNVTVTDCNATDIDKELDKEIELDSINNYTLSEKVREIISYLNERCSTNYRPSGKKTRSLINARLNEGFEVDEFKTVIDKKADEWIGSEYEKFLRPETLFGTKFEGYLNQKTVARKDAPFDWDAL